MDLLSGSCGVVFRSQLSPEKDAAWATDARFFFSAAIDALMVSRSVLSS